MAAPSRTAQFSRLYRILKKHYTPSAPDPNRSVLEQLLFATCLENAHPAVAEEAFAALVHSFFDWNEIRVSSVKELSEVMGNLPDPTAAAQRIKRILQTIFEATYSFDLEELRKQNLGPAIERLEKIEGTSRFSIAYVVQSALGGHAIPIDSGALGVLRLVDLVSEEDVSAGVVPGLERAIPKHSGVEFGSLLHQWGADYVATPYSPGLHAIILEVEPNAKDRLPSRRGPKRVIPEIPPPGAAAPPQAKTKPAASGVKPEAVKPAKEPKPLVSEPKKRPAATRKTPPGMPQPQPAQVQQSPPAEATPPSDPLAEPSKEPDPGKKKPPSGAKKAPPKNRPEPDNPEGQTDPKENLYAVEGLSKRKPR